MEKFQRVQELMQAKGGAVDVTDGDLIALLGQRLMYRLPTYMSFIRVKSNLKVRGVRVGRKVVRYELEAMVPETAAPAAVETPQQDAPVVIVATDTASV